MNLDEPVQSSNTRVLILYDANVAGRSIGEQNANLKISTVFGCTGAQKKPFWANFSSATENSQKSTNCIQLGWMRSHKVDLEEKSRLWKDRKSSSFRQIKTIETTIFQ